MLNRKAALGVRDRQRYFYAIRDEGSDGDFVAGWNAYIEGLSPGPAASDQFKQGWRKSRAAHDYQDLKALPEANPED